MAFAGYCESFLGIKTWDDKRRRICCHRKRLFSADGLASPIHLYRKASKLLHAYLAGHEKMRSPVLNDLGLLMSASDKSG